MKHILYTALLCALVTGSYAQESKKDTVVVIAVDSTKKEDPAKHRRVNVTINNWRNAEDSSEVRKSSKFSAQFTFSRFDLGLSKYMDNGSFTLSPANSFLENKTWKTINVGFDVFELHYRFNPYVKLYVAGGFDWNHIRLKQDINILPDQPQLSYEPATVDYDKNRLSSTYLRIPMGLQFRTRDDARGKKVFFVAGPEVGFLLNGKLKQVSDELGKEKIKDDFNFNPFRFGAAARLGYDDLGIFAKYYFSDVFADGQGPADFKNLSFGFMLNF
ncbi:MAG TPA: outer membrane beta-barrel protein [Sphingobacteriaceae bacterium]